MLDMRMALLCKPVIVNESCKAFMSTNLNVLSRASVLCFEQRLSNLL